jgi:hypothetical protein
MESGGRKTKVEAGEVERVGGDAREKADCMSGRGGVRGRAGGRAGGRAEEGRRNEGERTTKQGRKGRREEGEWEGRRHGGTGANRDQFITPLI